MPLLGVMQALPPLFVPYSVVCATLRTDASTTVATHTEAHIENNKLIATVVSDGMHYAIFLGLTVHTIAASALKHAKGGAVDQLRLPSASAAQTGLFDIWHASARLGWGRGSAREGIKALLGV
jgi:hypothetical protein